MIVIVMKEICKSIFLQVNVSSVYDINLFMPNMVHIFETNLTKCVYTNRCVFTKEEKRFFAVF